MSTVIIRFIAKRSRGRFIAQWGHTGKLNALVEESLTGHAIVKSFGRQHDVEAVFRKTNDDLYEASFGAQFISGTIQPAMVFLGNLNFVAIAVIGGLRVASRAMTIGGIQAFIQYSRQFSQPMQQLASMANLFQSGLASAERVFVLLDADEQSPDPRVVESEREPGGPQRERLPSEGLEAVDGALGRPIEREEPPAHEGRVPDEEGGGRVRGVAGHAVARTRRVRPRVVLVRPGPSAHHRSVARRRAGTHRRDRRTDRRREDDAREPDHAVLRARRRHRSRSTARTSRRCRGPSSARTSAWCCRTRGCSRARSATTSRYGNPDATEEQILEAARATYVDRFVHMLPDGYDTIVDDESGAISTGEKQLLTIARAFLSDPTILILDEATSSVDTRTEVLLQEAMAAIRSQRTSFVIAHRLSTIRNADVILVMEDGNIVEQGHHTDLLARKGAYARLYNAQFAAPIVEDAR